ncbi:MAG: biotin--[acetyl-CoA-carboxylase] ligase [Flavobacteriales bacterium]|nr:biotin--[acetyl-CoA-carboxylase] ligase [Flavobacteriales bacterium]
MRTHSIGQQIIELTSVPSTNKYAADQLALSKLPHGAVILAHEQTDGRGQRGRSWLATPGLDLAISVILLPQRLRATDQFALVRISALAVRETVAAVLAEAHAPRRNEVHVKWPNDVLIDRQKVAGILVKNEVVGGLITSVILGIGMNVNGTIPALDISATSLLRETGDVVDRQALLERLCLAVERRWDRWEAEAVDGKEEYRDHLWGRGRWMDMELDGAPVSGRPLDVDEDGRLLVEWPDGQVGAYGLERLRFAPR